VLFRTRAPHRPPPWLYPKPADDGIGGPIGNAQARAVADAALLDTLQRAAFDYFVLYTHPTNGLVADASREGSPSSIAVVGFALSSYPVGIERGWIERAEAVRRTLLAMRFFMASDQSGGPDSTGHHGFYFHFLDMQSGARTWQCELSMIDTALLIAGCLTAATYFTHDTPDERELRALADALYRRVDWRWAQVDGDAVALGWKPGHGFLSYGWQGYDEALILYVLGLGSPTHALDEASFRAWTMTYQWENLYGYDFLYAARSSSTSSHMPGSISAASATGSCVRSAATTSRTVAGRPTCTANTQRATRSASLAIRKTAGATLPAKARPPRRSRSAGASSASSATPRAAPPSVPTMERSPARPPWARCPSRRRSCCPLSASSPLAKVSKGSKRSKRLRVHHTVLASGFNATVPAGDAGGWLSAGQLGFDQGLILMMIENHRSGLPWRIGRNCAYLREGLRRAGFSGGWLRGPAAARR